MTVLLRAEILKLRTLLLPRLMLALAALGGGFIMYAVVRTAHDQHTTVSTTDLATAAAQPLWFLAVIVAVLATAAEFQHRTIESDTATGSAAPPTPRRQNTHRRRLRRHPDPASAPRPRSSSD